MTTRRGLLGAAAALPVSACAVGLRTRVGAAGSRDLGALDATATADLIRRREITAAEAVEAAVRRAERLNPKLNFLVASDFHRARARAAAGKATGPFAGVPTLVKDLSDVEGLPTRRGSRFTDGVPPARSTDPTNAAFLASGLIALGKSATPEYGFLPTTEPLAFPPTRNPWDLSRSSGGSSGGAAAAVAAGVVPIAHASDGGGSIRIPAALCGLFGLKPSRGRIVGDPVEATDLSVELCVSRSVRDSAALLAVMERRDSEAPLPPVGLVDGPSDARLRIGVFEAEPAGLPRDPEVARSIDVAVALLRGIGHAAEPVEWPFRAEDLSDAFWNAWAEGAAQLVGFARRRLGRAPTSAELEPFTLGLAERYATLPPGTMDRSRAALGRAARDYLALFGRFDVLVSPVTATAAPPLGWFRPDQPFDVLVERLTRFAAYTPLHNVAGSPAVSVPLHWTADGLPVGVQFAAAVGRERTLFELAYQLEAEKPWARRRPAVSA